jgi:hypothetical protein
MRRSYPHSHVARGQHVGCNLKKRDNDPCYDVYYRGINGRRLERDTQQTAAQRAHESAHAIIDAEYAPSLTARRVVSWDEAWRLLQEKAMAEGRRGPAIDYYGKLIRRIRKFYSVTTGPADISPVMAESWKRTFSSMLTRRKKFPSPYSVFSLVRGFNSLWQTWFVDELSICLANPWQDVAPPKTDRIDVRPIEDETLTHFLGLKQAKASADRREHFVNC